MTTFLKLSKDFTLAEMLRSDVATRMGFDEQFSPPIEVIRGLEQLTENILQPLRDAARSPIRVTSGYRCDRVNTAIHGAQGSQHVNGEAADIENYELGNEFLYNEILRLNLPFDQLINEFNFAWVHVSYSNRHRRQLLKAIRENGKTKYILL